MGQTNFAKASSEPLGLANKVAGKPDATRYTP